MLRCPSTRRNSEIPTLENPPSGQQFAPRVYAPRVYAPRVYAPRVYAPRVYAPRVYAPRVYAPGSYIPANVSDQSLSDAFSAAQNQMLLAASTNTGNVDEIVSASTGNTDGAFYLRVQGHDDAAFDDNTPFQLTRTTESANLECAGLTTFPKDPDDAAPAVTTQQTVIVTDTNRLNLPANSPAATEYLASLNQLAVATGGVVVNVAASDQVQALWGQVQGHRGCPQAVNMVADAIKTIVDDWRNTNSKYVVIAGGDDVIPFFRYQDVSGLGPESQFEPPLLPDTPAGASLLQDQVQSQDAYGSNISVTIGGVSVPLPDLAVGRLVKTPAEIQGTVANFVTLGGNLPEPDTSLVTGYDFLADAADAVHGEFRAALPAAGAVADTLITHPDADPAETPWNATQLRNALLGSHHDVVYLAGHFSANDTLAADFSTTFDADDLGLAANAGKLLNTLVLSAGCHSGYSIVDAAGVPAGGTFPGTNTVDWTQRMAQQKAVLIGGTGYQYGDTDFLEYSERLYLDIARRLHEDTGSTAPIAIGNALVLAKQDYLSGLTTLSGIDQKAMLQATLYGLPMMGFDATRRSALPTRTSTVGTTTPVPTGTAGAGLGLTTADLPVVTANSPDSKPVVLAAQTFNLRWFNGADGVTIQPGAPAIPKQVKDVTVANKILRGVGFWSGDYTDTNNVLPLTGAPAIEATTPNSTFLSDTFFPQRLATVNYFGALGDSGRTTLVVNPAQYRTFGDPDAAVPVNTVRNYANLDMKLFYSPKTFTVPVGQPDPGSAAPPGISEVTGTAANGVVTFSARVTGDPVAGVQQAWVTWTGTQGSSGHGHWRSIPLTQNPADSTLWTGTLNLPSGQPFNDVRFLVQAVNGVGVHSLDAAEGDGYAVTQANAVDTAGINVLSGVPTAGSPLGVTAHVETASGVDVAGREVTFRVLQGAATLFQTTAITGSGGNAVLTPPPGPLPVGYFTVVASILGADGQVSASDTAVDVDTSTVAFQPSATADLGSSAVVKDVGGIVWAGRKVVVTVSRGGSTLHTINGTTDTAGKVDVDFPGVLPSGRLTLRAELFDAAGTSVRQTATTDVVLAGLVVAPSVAFLEAKTGTTYPAFSVTVSDNRGPVAGVPVTFNLPTGTPSAGFTNGSNSAPLTSQATVTTNAQGVALAPTMVAKSVVGSFYLTVTADGLATPLQVPMAAQYGIGAFVSPVSASVTTTATGTTPVKVAVLGPNGSKLSDADAAALLTAKRIQIRWKKVGTTTWLTLPNLPITYDNKKDFFQADMKASTVGWTKPNSYTVEFRVLPRPTDIQPAPMPATAASALASDFDFGSRAFTIRVT